MYHFENFVLCEGVVVIRSEGPKHLYRRLGIDVDRGYPHGAQNDGVKQEPEKVLESHIHSQFSRVQLRAPQDVFPDIGISINDLDILGNMRHGDGVHPGPEEEVVVTPGDLLFIEQ